MDGRAGQDWSGLDDAARAVAAERCWQHAHDAQTDLAPFAKLCARQLPRAGSLAGLPYALKDMFEVAGRRPSWGLAASPFPSDCTQTAEVVRRLDAAGAERVGFTKMTALAYEPSGVNLLQTPPLNPWNRDFAPGGSSSGSAVAVAAQLAFVAVGSDTGGSLRIPAQACSITAWKPTWGLVPGSGAMPLAKSLDTIGLLALSARDIELVRPVLCNTPAEPLLPAAPRIAVVCADALAAAERSVRNACEDGIAALARHGFEIRERTGLPIIEAAGQETLTLMAGEAARAHAARFAGNLGDAALARRLTKGLSIGDAAMAASLSGRAEMSRQFDDLLGPDAQFLILPVAPIRTPLLAEVDPRSPRFRPRTLYELSAYTRFVNYLGLPAVALPIGRDDRGLPLALQLVARPDADRALLAAAIEFQAGTDWHLMRP